MFQVQDKRKHLASTNPLICTNDPISSFFSLGAHYFLLQLIAHHIAEDMMNTSSAAVSEKRTVRTINTSADTLVDANDLMAARMLCRIYGMCQQFLFLVSSDRMLLLTRQTFVVVDSVPESRLTLTRLLTQGNINVLVSAVVVACRCCCCCDNNILLLIYS